MEIIPVKKKLKREIFCSKKVIMPMKKYLKHICIKESQIKAIMDYNKTCDNICQ
jgi:hypothetical protein